MIGNRFNKIAIIGAAGVGKTTLLNSLFEDSTISVKYTKIEEVVRKLCAERGFENPYSITGDLDQFRHDVLMRQIYEENKAESFISDRSTIDAWAYYMRWSWNTSTVEKTEEFYQAAYKQAQQYDQIIYLPIMFEERNPANQSFASDADTKKVGTMQSMSPASKKQWNFRENPIQDDGFRWNNAIYQKQIDRLLRSIIYDWGFSDKVYEIKSETIDHRLQELFDLGF
ncbi:MAG: AAA family ATPase [Cyanobacteria bacterium]|nr:AAA family ATPase [Cyanobacteriota bacterium]